MNLLAFDPSIRRTGWAAFDGNTWTAGVIEPPKTGEIWERLDSLAMDVLTVLEQIQPEHIIIEYGSGHVDPKRHGGGGYGMSIYGAACECVRQTALRAWSVVTADARLHCVSEAWCRAVPKKLRPVIAGDIFPAYATNSDPGADIADAICLLDWWMKENGMAMTYLTHQGEIEP